MTKPKVDHKGCMQRFYDMLKPLQLETDALGIGL